MRRFDTVHRIPTRGLGATHTHEHIDLQSMATQAWNNIVAECPNIPPPQYTIQWKNMSHGQLGYASTYFQRQHDVWVPAYEFEIYLNPHVSWWSGSCTTMPSNHYDLNTVVMHEILHGIGFLSTVTKDKTAFPSNFDRLIRDVNGHALVDTGGTFHGDFGQSVYIDTVRLYNPSLFDEGSSLSHVHRSAKVMSWYQSSCHRHLDTHTKRVLNQIDAGCSLENKNTQEPLDVDAIVWLVIAAGVVVTILVMSICLCKQGRKKREFPPLLQNANM